MFLCLKHTHTHTQVYLLQAMSFRILVFAAGEVVGALTQMEVCVYLITPYECFITSKHLFFH